MRALSLWQPHAQAIALGLKPWETRDWPTRYRGPLAIHGAKRLWHETGAWHDDARRTLHRRQAELGRGFALAYGAVVCVDGEKRDAGPATWAETTESYRARSASLGSLVAIIAVLIDLRT